MGGWYSPSTNFDPPKNMTGYVPGHTFGQYLSGLSRAYAITRRSSDAAEGPSARRRFRSHLSQSSIATTASPPTPSTRRTAASSTRTSSPHDPARA